MTRPSSSRITFELSVLRHKALKNIDDQIERKKKELDDFTDPEAENQAYTDWFEEQVRKIESLYNALKHNRLSYDELAAFRIDPVPRVDEVEVRKRTHEVEVLKIRRSQVEAKASALVPDADGNVLLTVTQLDEFFGL